MKSMILIAATMLLFSACVSRIKIRYQDGSTQWFNNSKKLSLKVGDTLLVLGSTGGHWFRTKRGAPNSTSTTRVPSSTTTIVHRNPEIYFLYSDSLAKKPGVVQAVVIRM